MKVVLPRGRLLQKSLNLLNATQFDFQNPNGRELLLDEGEHQLLMAKAFDVPLYVEGGSDIGITGRDVVEERGSDVFIPLTLPFGKCRLSLAMPQDKAKPVDRLEGYRIATEYPNITQNYFESLGVNVKIMAVQGSTELAPRADLSDAIVDIVQTGTTLEANGLVEVQEIMQVSALLLVNRISQKTRFEEINQLVSAVRSMIQDGS